MTSWLRRLNTLLSPGERWRLGVLLAVLSVTALFQAFGVASIMPFIAVLANPDIVETNPWLAWAYAGLGFSDRRGFLLALGTLFLVLLLGSLALQALGLWLSLRFAHNRGWRWGLRLLQNYLGKPYSWHLNRNSAGLSAAVLSEVGQLINGLLFPALQIIAQGLTALCLVAVLVTVDPLLALGSGAALGGGFWLVQVAVRRRLVLLGQSRRRANAQRFQVVQEAFGGVKDVKVLGLEATLTGRFVAPSQELARTVIKSELIGRLPPLAMQALLFGGMLLALLYLLASYGSFAEAIPVLALFGFAGYRLMPALQAIYGHLGAIRFNQAVLDALADDLQAPAAAPPVSTTVPPPRLHQALALDQVSYRYPGARQQALASLSLVIPANHTVALVGPSGSGKSTTADLILGLLEPAGGCLRVDGQPLSAAQRAAWRGKLGYVPQQIFLVDGSVAQNIAFGLPAEAIDQAAVERAARLANLHDFVVNELPQGYDTEVGERGVRLSGGQRQRIGIARALYHDPELLVMDEATSALDTLTEQAVMDAVHNLAHRKTIVLIAHRLSTVRGCDCIYVLENGRLTGAGTYDELVAGHARFRAMAQAG